MFCVTESDVAAIRAAFQKGGELAAAVELRQRFAGIASLAEARASARRIAGWRPPENPSPAPPNSAAE
jgi:hypothetical protein